MTITATHRELYEQMWGIESYASYAPGAELVELFLDMAQPLPGASILDAGTGSGKGALALAAQGFEVSCFDLTDAGLVPEARRLPFQAGSLWHLDSGPRVDWVYCTDVMEHLPTAFAMLTVDRLLARARRGVFLSIALQADDFGVWAGTDLHQTVQSFTDWRDQLQELATVVEARDLLQQGVYLVCR